MNSHLRFVCHVFVKVCLSFVRMPCQIFVRYKFVWHAPPMCMKCTSCLYGILLSMHPCQAYWSTPNFLRSARDYSPTQNYHLRRNYFEIFIFEKFRISRVISGKNLSFREILRVQIPSKITNTNSQGVIFVIISVSFSPRTRSLDVFLEGRQAQEQILEELLAVSPSTGASLT